MTSRLLDSPADPHAEPASDLGCLSCGVARSGRFCSGCGQRHHTGRLTISSVAGQLASETMDLERGVPYTAVQLLRAPGRTVSRFLRGEISRFTHPARYFLLCVTLAHLSATWAGTIRDAVPGFARGMGSEEAGLIAAVDDYFVLLFALALPLLALSSRILFARAGRGFAEHLVFNLFVLAQQNLYFALWSQAVRPLPRQPEYWTSLAFFLAHFAYYAWAAGSFFGVRWYRALPLTLLIHLLSLVVYLILGSIVAQEWW